MINPKELRLGVDIQHQHYKDMWVDIKVSAKDIEIAEQLNTIYRPIPLTEEVLLKCGFELEYQSIYRTVYVLSKDSRFGYEWTKSFEWRVRYRAEHFPNIKSLHNLQNLVFTITQTELNYKP